MKVECKVALCIKILVMEEDMDTINPAYQMKMDN